MRKRTKENWKEDEEEEENKNEDKQQQVGRQGCEDREGSMEYQAREQVGQVIKIIMFLLPPMH